jgi:hypothetical protein
MHEQETRRIDVSRMMLVAELAGGAHYNQYQSDVYCQ